MSDRLDDAERDTDREGEERGDETVIDGDRKPVGDHRENGCVVAERLSEIELQRLPEPDPVSDRDRLIKPVELLQLLQLVVGDRELHPGARAASEFSAGARKLKLKLFDRPAGNELAQQEGRYGD